MMYMALGWGLHIYIHIVHAAHYTTYTLYVLSCTLGISFHLIQILTLLLHTCTYYYMYIGTYYHVCT